MKGSERPVKKVLMLASVASMIDQFNMPNIELLQQMGYEVHVAANFTHGSTSSKERLDEFKIKLANMRVHFYHVDFSRQIANIFQHIRAYYQVKNLMQQNNYSFVHCHSPIGGVVGRLVAKKTGTPVIYTAHGFHFYNGAPILNWLLYYPVERWLARYTDVLITINKEDYDRATTFKAHKVEYIPGVGIDLDRFSSIGVVKDDKRKKLGLPEDAFVILSVGELNKNKNHEVVVRALAKFRCSQIHYVICGQGKYAGRLENLSKDLGVVSQVHLLGFRDDISDIYSVSDLFVFPSFREGLSVALMEAMANGLPIVCSSIRGNSDLIEHGINGYLVSPDDVDGFVKYINKVMSNEDISKRFGDLNLERIKERSAENITNSMQEIYRDEFKFKK